MDEDMLIGFIRLYCGYIVGGVLWRRTVYSINLEAVITTVDNLEDYLALIIWRYLFLCCLYWKMSINVVEACGY